MTFTKLVVAGSTGTLADHVLPMILASTQPKFDVTVLTRQDKNKKKQTLPPAGAKLIAADYNDHAALVHAVAGADAIISVLSGIAAVTTDKKLLKAAQEAGVRRIFVQWPEGFETVVDAARKFQAVGHEVDGPTSYTTLVTSGFIDQWLKGTYGTFDPRGRKVQLIGGGDKHLTGCSLPFIASCLLATLQMDEEKTKNKRIRIAEVRTTMNEIVKTYEELTGLGFDTPAVSSQDLLAMRGEAVKAGNWESAWMCNILIGAFNGSGPGDLEDGLLFVGDGFLAVPRKTLKELCSDALKGIGTV